MTDIKGFGRDQDISAADAGADADAADLFRDPLADLAERAKSDHAAAFTPDVLEALAELQASDRGGFEVIRAGLKRSGVRVSALDAALAAASRDDGGADADAEAPDDRRGPPQRDRVVAALLDAGAVFWRDSDADAYCTVKIAGTLQRHQVRSTAFRHLARSIYGSTNPRMIGSTLMPSSLSEQCWREVVPQLEAISYTAPIRRPAIRSLRDGDRIIVDIGDPSWRAIEVSAGGWRVIDSTDVPLIRAAGVEALAYPVRAQNALADLALLGNVPDENSLRLVAAWLVMALWPTGPYPILAVSGESESGKTSVCRLLRRIIDPNGADLRKPPRDNRDIVLAASNGRVLGFENLSFIDAELSDDLCRASTGAGFGTRLLYSNAEEHLAYVCAPILLNGIPCLMARGDLASRSLVVTAPPIPPERRMTEEAFASACDAALPGIFALVLDGLALALRDLATFNLPDPPRLGLAAKIAACAAPAFGWTPAEMLAAIRQNRADAATASVEADPVAGAIAAVLGDAVSWQGSATALLSRLCDLVPESERNRKTWPADAIRLATRLRLIAPSLRILGIEIEMGDRTNKRRLVTIAKREVGKTSSPSSPSSPQRKNGGFPPVSEPSAGDDESGAIVTASSPSSPSSPHRHRIVTPNPLKNNISDDGDDGDDVSRTFGGELTDEDKIEL